MEVAGRQKLIYKLVDGLHCLKETEINKNKIIINKKINKQRNFTWIKSKDL